MDSSSSLPLALVVGSIFLAMGGLILVTGWQLPNPNRRFFGTATPRRVLLEVGLIMLGVSLPIIFVDGMILAGFEPAKSQVIQASNFFSAVSPVVYPLVLPLWIAIRLKPPDASNLWGLGSAYLRLTGGIMLGLLSLLVVSDFFLFFPVLEVIEPSIEITMRHPFLLDAFLQILAAGILFAMMRGGLEVWRSAPQLAEYFPGASAMKHDTGRFYLLVAVAGLLGVGLWVWSLVIYDFAPETAYVPPSFTSQTGVSFDIPTPLERPRAMAVLLAVLALAWLGLSLWLALFVRPDEPAARVFTLLGLLYGVAAIEIFPKQIGPLTIGPFLYGATVFARVLIMPVQVHFALVFPRADLTAKSSSPRRRRVGLWLLYGLFAGLALAWVPLFVQAERLAAEFAEVTQLLEASPDALTSEAFARLLRMAFWGIAAMLFLLATGLAWLLSGGFLIRTWRAVRGAWKALNDDVTAASEVEDKKRRALREGLEQIRWVGMGGIVSAVGLGVSYFVLGPLWGAEWGDWVNVMIKGSLLILGASITIALLKYQLWNMGLLIRWFVVHLVVTLLFVGVYAGIVTGLRSLLGELNELAGLLATGFIVALFYPVRDWVQSLIDRRFFRQKLAFREQMQALSERLAQTIEFERLAQLLTVEVPQQLQLTQAWLVQPLKTRLETEVETLAGQGASLPLPLQVGEEVIGVYAVGGKKSGLELDSEEKGFLQALSHQAATALANVRAVEAREAELQERHRIVDEIHDTAKQKLDAANIWIHNSKPLMNQQPEETENPLQLAEDLMEAASDELEYAMRLLAGEFSKESAWESSPIPLPEALQKLVSLYARLGNFREQVQIHGEPQPMPRATEETLKRIAREALFNIVKHAQAQMVQVTLQYEPQEVLLSIADDGRGMRPKGRAGFGLQSMNKRAQEIKGTFQVESAPDQGTRIEVRVPIRGE